ncbi:CoA ester lyase [Nordella sp. HKS 07]|uniref:HpcH/HpaI aldolase/citrate lyase family protein n=1 Tax=Nordella sp. HKS 07 TaxID=2712222 RepID=UPI0013E19AB5|nr:CoA ester lyase [Nordella sp. HKS 07]QIG51579.1 CoA ester lyase [Nordella sp. HKS 07]
MRSFLFVPADSEKKLRKALGGAADAVILDLEDSVALADKPKARALAREVLAAPRGSMKLFVRVNALTTGLTGDDLDAVTAAAPDGLVLPKSESGADVKRLVEMAGLPVVAIATETAASLFNLGTYGDCGPELLGLTWGMEDLAAALGAQANRDALGRPTGPYELARTLCLIGARAAGVEPIDAVYANFRDLAGLEVQCHDAVRDGFTAKMCIHPDQIDVVNRIFTPSPEAVARARRIVDAFAQAGDAGVIGLDGEMLDVPHLKAAKALLARVAG